MDIITGIILFLLAGASFFISVRSFMEKGFLFNNAYIYASKEQREKMNKKTLLSSICDYIFTFRPGFPFEWFFSNFQSRLDILCCNSNYNNRFGLYHCIRNNEKQK